jgi:hypothetical protein
MTSLVELSISKLSIHTAAMSFFVMLCPSEGMFSGSGVLILKAGWKDPHRERGGNFMPANGPATVQI